MDVQQNKFITVWAAINKNGKISLHKEMPTRDIEHGIWVSKYPYINSIIYTNLKNMLEKTEMSWECNPEPFQINV